MALPKQSQAWPMVIKFYNEITLLGDERAVAIVYLNFLQAFGIISQQIRYSKTICWLG